MIYKKSSKQDIKSLKHIWLEALSAVGIDTSVTLINEQFQDLIKRYQDKRRYYHNAGHLTELFDYWSQYKHVLQDPSEIALALFYHDIIYDAANTDNEEQSAALARKSLQSMGLDKNKAERIAALIIMTKTHECKNHDSDAAYMLDMDMAVLGQEWAQYDKYRQAIECEYVGTYSEQEFIAGRLQLYLNPWLQKGRFFQTDLFEKKYAENCRRNLQKEKDILSARLK